MFHPKDFIETPEGLLFAVVSAEPEQGKYLCVLRYVRENGVWSKKNTDQANGFLRCNYPEFLHYSSTADADLHAVAAERIFKHHQPRQRLQSILRGHSDDPIEQDVRWLCDLLEQRGVCLDEIGITGSILIGAHNEHSDIDLVCYGHRVFDACRDAVRALVVQGRLQSLSENDWLISYQRRNCSLSYEDYVRHELRKYNKAMVNGRKFDLSLLASSRAGSKGAFQKKGAITLVCRVTDATQAFDFPAKYRVDQEGIDAIVSFTATYAGQAVIGETIEVSGMLEENAQGLQQIVVGSSREAHGEYIRVIDV